MFDIKHVTIDNKRWELRTNDGRFWGLHTNYARGVLAIPAAHLLNYWRRKGVMYGEAKKETQG